MMTKFLTHRFCAYVTSKEDHKYSYIKGGIPPCTQWISFIFYGTDLM